MTPESDAPRFAVDMTSLAKEQLRQLVHHARYSSVAPSVITAFAQLVDRLGREPFDLGKPKYEFRAMEVQIRMAAISPVCVEYGVHRHDHWVIIRQVIRLPGPLR